MKRSGDFHPSPRPWKRRRVGTEDVHVSCGALSRCKAEPRGKDGEGGDEPLVFLNATAEAVAAFDWSALLGAQDASEDGHVHVKDEKDATSVESSPVRTVPISRYLMLNEIRRYFGLRAFGFGIVKEPRGVLRGWLEMEIPPGRAPSGKRPKKFYSDEERTERAAMEGVCNEAIAYMRMACFVVVDDVNLEDMTAAEKRADANESWLTLYDAELEKRSKSLAVARRSHASFFADITKLCTEFSDVFAGGAIGNTNGPAARGGGGICYVGPVPPITRADQFAFRLVELINRCGRLAKM